MAQINQLSTPSGSIQLPTSGSIALFSEPTDSGKLYIKDYQGNIYPAVSGSGGGSSLIPIQNDGTPVGSASTLNFSGSAVDSISILSGVATIGLSGGAGGSGSSGTSGESGTSGISGATGNPGTSGTSGANGATGNPGTSGTSGANGATGNAGTSGTSGADGTSGINGTSGTSGIDGTSGTSGADGAAGDAGSSGTSGEAGTSGTSGANGATGNAGTSGTSGADGAIGNPGTSGTSGADGTSGTSGANGATGDAGSSGTSGANGATGDAGSSGTSGANGATGNPGTSGTSGADGTSGTSGANGATGDTGTSGTSGADGAIGTSGTSGANGAPGDIGTSGTSGATGAAGSAGTSGASGTSGTSAASGGGTPYNNVVRYKYISGSDSIEMMSAGNIISDLSWARSGTTLTITSTSHGLTSGDYVVLRNFNVDYVYVSIIVSDSNTFTCTVADSGTTSGSTGVYIPACKASSLSDAGVTLTPPSSGNIQIISAKIFIAAAETGTFVLTVNGDIDNGAGDNDALNTKNPPLMNWWDASTSTVAMNSSTKVSFSKTTNFSQFNIDGGSIDTGGEAICRITF